MDCPRSETRRQHSKGAGYVFTRPGPEADVEHSTFIALVLHSPTGHRFSPVGKEMSNLTRVILLLLACVIGGSFALLGVTFTFAVEPQSSRIAIAAWLAIGVAFSFPAWLPAVVPARLNRLHVSVRRVCAILLCFPAQLFASTVVNQLGRMHSHQESNPAILAEGMALTLACLLALALLLKSDVLRFISWWRKPKLAR
ncbi:hypothetical protein M2D07_022685, partial [Pseudomonas sp. BGr12]|uniref:hypothetical protein n=2 Tax=unclassified Pseudomonas TaxID=196821 RepID=UPI00255A2FE3